MIHIGDTANNWNSGGKKGLRKLSILPGTPNNCTFPLLKCILLNSLLNTNYTQDNQRFIFYMKNLSRGKRCLALKKKSPQDEFFNAKQRIRQSIFFLINDGYFTRGNITFCSISQPLKTLRQIIHREDFMEKIEMNKTLKLKERWKEMTAIKVIIQFF